MAAKALNAVCRFRGRAALEEGKPLPIVAPVHAVVLQFSDLT